MGRGSRLHYDGFHPWIGVRHFFVLLGYLLVSCFWVDYVELGVEAVGSIILLLKV